MIQSGSNNRGVIQRLIQGRELETYSTPSETSLMELFVEIVACISPLTIFAKHFILFVSQRYEICPDKIKPNPNVLSFISQRIRTTISAS